MEVPKHPNTQVPKHHRMRKPLRLGIWLLGCWGLCLLLGCGPAFESSVSGKVTHGGQPLSKGNVSFHPVAGGPVAYGTIQSDGTYSVKTGTGQGLPPGEYKVTVSATDPPPPDVEDAPGVLITPPQYNNVKTTPLTKTISPGANVINIDLP